VLGKPRQSGHPNPGEGNHVTKTAILAEIQRTTAENGGVPLGRRRFAAETGVKDADWYGVYWARWGDAVREAGFRPNQLQRPYPTDHLLTKYAELALELGCLPVRGDLDLKRRRDRGFPSREAFERLGTKAVLLRQVAEFCRSRPGLDAVAGWCQEWLNSRQADAEVPATTENVALGYVYLVKSGRYYKIGRSNAARRREYELGRELPERVQRIHIIRTDDPRGIEKYWHQRFATQHKHGEWFDLEPADIRAFKRRKFM
jgi:hypothetical protein